MENTIPMLLRHISSKHPYLTAQMHKDAKGEFQPTSFRELFDQVKHFAAGLLVCGVKRGDRIGLISDNRREWFIADLGIQCLGAIDVPRGCDSTADEIVYILSFSQCTFTVLENAHQFEKIAARIEELPDLKTVIILDPDFEAESAISTSLAIYSFLDVIEKGMSKNPMLIDAEIDLGQADDTVTIIYTSGTTGEPKGVMLSHRNFLYQVNNVPQLIQVGPGDRWLSILPVWHSFERIMQYVALGSASTLCYSKPVGSILLEDMQKVRPTWMASVPRIWESVRDGIYNKVNQSGGIKKILFLFFVAVGSTWKTSENLLRGRMPRFKKRSRRLDRIMGFIPYTLLWPFKILGNMLIFKNIKEKLGGRFVAGISGGGSLPAHVDTFFQAAEILLLEGYGLTESAPVLSLRPQNHPVPGTIGPPLPDTELKIVGENGEILGTNQVGVLHARGPQVMKGYYRKDELTAQVIDSDGWLNTGDLAKKTHDGEYAIVGRAKDTIVLLGGENIEPAPIEEKLKISPYISRAIIVGQDQKFLGALIISDINNVKQWAEENNVSAIDDTQLVTGPEVHHLLSDEISSLISTKNGFKIFEKIVRFTVLTDEFEVGRELSAKQEIKRHFIHDAYSKEISGLFKSI